MRVALTFVALAFPIQEELRIDELLVVESTASHRRSPVVQDVVEAYLVRGTLETPVEGGEVPRADGDPLVWRPIEAGENGRFADPALRFGWGHATVEREAAGVMLLDARGHRRVYVNGVPRGGDLYDLGILRLPVKLEPGPNQLLFRGSRGGLSAKLVEPPAPVYLETLDRTLPDVLRGSTQTLRLGIRVGNATEEWQEGLSVAAHVRGEESRTVSGLPTLPPLSQRQVTVSVVPPEEPGKGPLPIRLELRAADGTTLHGDSFELAVKDPGGKHKRTFASLVDDSVQYFAVTPPSEELEHPALFLSLHGASVQATNQAYSYAPKDWGVVVAPTNRRPFGFDWEDWGRYDALEVFALARELYDTDPRRQYLTGHSMGGHGTWNLGAHLPGTFAAIAPSAGWRDFWSYAGKPEENPDPVLELIDDAANASRTLLLEENYLHAGVYVLHGDADDNVPVSQARFMRERLAAFHPNWAYYERAGAGHWWGNECMDWPPLFRFLRDNVTPESVDAVSFVTVNPAINATCHWVTIHAQERSMEPSQVDARLDREAGKLTATLDNVACVRFDLPDVGHFELNGSEYMTTPHGGPSYFTREDGEWIPAERPNDGLKSPRRAGPFKDAFRRDMTFVVGTHGSAERTRLLYAKARLDSEIFGYRGNGAVSIVGDADYDPAVYGNVILYGNADDNAAWATLLADSPVQVRDGGLAVGERTVAGDDLAVLFVWPWRSSPERLVAAIAPTGDVGARLAATLPYFVSGLGYPDWTVVGAEMLEVGAAGIRAAGYFGPYWDLESGRDAWR
jgi:poly(3-hydroxybutyrate) depolymerase